MTITRITVRTMNGNYEEMCYGLAEMTERVGMIEECDIVLGVEVMSMETGEILYTHTFYPTENIYVAETLVLDLVKEVLGQGLTKPPSLCYNKENKAKEVKTMRSPPK